MQTLVKTKIGRAKVLALSMLAFASIVYVGFFWHQTYQLAGATASDGTVTAEQKISDTLDGLTTSLDDSDEFGSSVANLGDLMGMK